MKICLSCDHVFATHSQVCPACGYMPVQAEGFEVYAPEFAYAGSGFKPEYFAELARLEATNFWFSARNQLIILALRKYQPQARSFLEVGCGTGFVLSGIAAAFPDMRIHGSEIFLAGLSHAATRVTTAHLMQMDARRLPFVSEFDVIGAFDVLEHIEEDDMVLAKLYRALTLEGVLLLTVPQHPWLWSSADGQACHVRRYTASELHRKLNHCGYKIERSTSFVSLLLPVMLLSRWTRKKMNQTPDPLAELRLPTALNNLLLGVMRIEHNGIRLGMDMPLGGSRLIVARKSG